ncbi:RFA2 [[Candida] subhashii]|uniref:RFA2 n=1 Tax=[Candida] subhashii TaxID=561895 RepID=A0A8J5Q9I3_9ASCO|nr:RFA2 [[Candida] subhashii]KAG7663149.1 RFA2 [[Candida] subhashii]
MSDYNYGNYGDGGFNTGTHSAGGGGGFSADNSSSQKQQLRTSLTPVTVKQINEATQPIPDGEFKIHNVELNMVSFVGVVRKVDVHASAVVITVEDGTGSIEVRKWIDEGLTNVNQEQEKFQQQLDKYVFVGGALKEFNSKKNIQNAHVYPITDSNQILYHHLSAIELHLKSQGVPSSKANNSNSLFVSNPNENQAPSGSLSDQILVVLRSQIQTMPEGVPVSYVAQKLNIAYEVAMNHCQTLADDGKIYAGYDETTFLCI